MLRNTNSIKILRKLSTNIYLNNLRYNFIIKFLLVKQIFLNMKRFIGLILIVATLTASIKAQEFAEKAANSHRRSKDFRRAIRDIVIDEMNSHSNHGVHDHADHYRSHSHDDRSYLLNPLEMTNEEMAAGRKATEEVHRHQCVHDDLVVAANHDHFAHWKVINDPEGLLSHEEVVASYKNFDLA